MNLTLAFIAAGAAAVLTRYALQLEGLIEASSVPLPDTRGIRLIVGAVYFAVLFLLGRNAFRDASPAGPPAQPGKDPFTPKATPQETSAEMARIFSDVTDDVSPGNAIPLWLHGVPRCTALMPFIFYLRFGTIGPLGWGLTVFFDVLCLLWAVGLYFEPRTEYHSPVKLRGDWIDRIGAFWLVACAFGPFFGWILTEALPVTQNSWHWLYGLRAFLAAGLPMLLALPATRYIRGKAATVALPLLVILTFLPVSTAIQVSRDLWDGPSVRQLPSAGGSELYLKHTDRPLGTLPLPEGPPPSLRATAAH